MKKGFVCALVIVFGLLVASPAKADFNVLETIQNILDQITLVGKKVTTKISEIKKMRTDALQAVPKVDLEALKSKLPEIPGIDPENLEKLKATPLMMDTAYFEGIDSNQSPFEDEASTKQLMDNVQEKESGTGARMEALLLEPDAIDAIERSGGYKDVAPGSSGTDVENTTQVQRKTLAEVHYKLSVYVADLYARAHKAQLDMDAEEAIKLPEGDLLTEDTALRTLHKQMLQSSLRLSHIKLLENYSLALTAYQEFKNIEDHMKRYEAMGGGE